MRGQTARRTSSWLIAAIVLVAGYGVMASSFGSAVDRLIAPLRFAAVARQASGKVVVVEMDAASAAAIRRWPWSRTNYAAVVDRLHTAGAVSIVFDVDFSSAADAAGDRAFAAALARADGTVVLPTFGQNASAADRRTIDALPISILRAEAALASVSIAPDPDGQVRSMPLATMTAATPRPSLSAFIAARSGAVDTTFPIDMSIDPASIPRLSFVAVRDGRFDPRAVAGRNILIGATAIEMGDRYGTPQWGVIPGVIVQALAAETLLRGVPQPGWPPALFALAALSLAAMVRQRRPAVIVGVAVGSVAMLVLTALLLQHVWLLVYPLAPALAVVALGAAACLTRAIVARFRAQRMVDEATGLPNVRGLLATSTDKEDVTIGVAQIDNYDSLQTVLGAAATATLIARVAERLALVGLDATVYRSGNRHLAFRMAGESVVDDTLDGLRALMFTPVEIAGRRVDVAMSVGIATGSGGEVERLLGDATMAASEACRTDVFWRRAAADLDDLARAVSLMGELDAALADGHLEVFYQPKYHLRERRISSVEALVRWRHETRGLIGPDLFIPAAERTNRIAPLTLYVLERVIADVAGWRALHGGITAAINVSAKLLSNGPFNAEVERLLTMAGVDASALVFEVTESAAMSDPAAAIAALHHYRELGVKVSMDDYGTGQSTLTYLRQLPLNELKIDRSFVQHAHRNLNDAVLVRSTIALAHELGLDVVAEGVEEPECMSLLTECGCDMVQGYLISRPVPLDALLSLFDRPHDIAA